MPDNERVLIVTGASSGIGAALARAAAGAGYRVAIVARRAEHLEEVARSDSRWRRYGRADRGRRYRRRYAGANRQYGAELVRANRRRRQQCGRRRARRTARADRRCNRGTMAASRRRTVEDLSRRAAASRSRSRTTRLSRLGHRSRAASQLRRLRACQGRDSSCGDSVATRVARSRSCRYVRRSRIGRDRVSQSDGNRTRERRSRGLAGAGRARDLAWHRTPLRGCQRRAAAHRRRHTWRVVRNSCRRVHYFAPHPARGA